MFHRAEGQRFSTISESAQLCRKAKIEIGRFSPRDRRSVLCQQSVIARMSQQEHNHDHDGNGKVDKPAGGRRTSNSITRQGGLEQ